MARKTVLKVLSNILVLTIILYNTALAAEVRTSNTLEAKVIVIENVANVTNDTELTEALSNQNVTKINLAAGNYSNPIVINRPLIINGAKVDVDARTRGLAGSGESVLVCNAGDGAIQIKSSNVTINGLKITNAVKGINVMGSTVDASGSPVENILIKNNIISSAANDGINLWRASSAAVKNNLIVNAGNNGITSGDDRGTLDPGDDTVTDADINDNKIVNASYGITGYMKDSVITGNTVTCSNKSEGYDTERPSTKGGTVVDGIGISGQLTSTEVSSNTVSGYIGTGGNYGGGCGIYIGASTNRPASNNCTITDNTLQNNNFGIKVKAGSSISIPQNTFLGNCVNVYDEINNKYEYPVTLKWSSGSDTLTITDVKVNEEQAFTFNVTAKEAMEKVKYYLESDKQINVSIGGTPIAGKEDTTTKKWIYTVEDEVSFTSGSLTDTVEMKIKFTTTGEHNITVYAVRVMP